MKRFIALTITAMWTAVAAAACVADVETAPIDPPAIEAQQVGQFSPYVFAFHTTIQDDGQGEAGGYQEAYARLEFPGVRAGLICSVTVGMAVRSSQDGFVSHAKAAEITALIATAAASGAYRSRRRWVGPEFCGVWHDWMRKIFANTHPGLGARVSA